MARRNIKNTTVEIRYRKEDGTLSSIRANGVDIDVDVREYNTIKLDSLYNIVQESILYLPIKSVTLTNGDWTFEEGLGWKS